MSPLRPGAARALSLALLALAACAPAAPAIVPVRTTQPAASRDPAGDGAGATSLAAQLERAAAPADGPRYIFVGLAMSDQSPAFYADIRNLDRLLAHRFGDAYRSVLLTNREPLERVRDLPLATPDRIDAVFARLRAARRPDDRFIVLFTTHGGRRVLAEQRPGAHDQLVTSATLGRWIGGLAPNRTWVLVSACFAGSHLRELEGPNVLAMTAADGDSTSLGCGTLSRGTYFVSALTRSLDFGHSFDQVWTDTTSRLAGWEKQLELPGAHPQVRYGQDLRALREGPVSDF